MRFRRRDYLGDPAVPLADAVRALVADRTGAAPDGPIRLLTNLRTLGRCFNPVSFYYCFDRDERLEAVVAEVTNTPWGERHAYVLTGGGRVLRGEHKKAMRVSPFMGMEQRYAVRHRAGPDALGAHRDQPGGRPRVRRHAQRLQLAGRSGPRYPGRCACCR